MLLLVSALTLVLAAPADAAAHGGLAARPKPPPSSEMREATPEPRGSPVTCARRAGPGRD